MLRRDFICVVFILVVLNATSSIGEDKPSATVRSGKTAGEVFELKIGQDVVIRFSWCPAGRFLMGSPVSEQGRDADERQVRVTLTKGFWISQTEVTQHLWKEVMLSTPWSGINGIANIPELPATNISYTDTIRFCAILTTRASNQSLDSRWHVQLPTEAQWEYACRAGTSSTFSYGDSPKELGKYAWFYANRLPDNEQLMAQNVGQLAPNDWGLYDMMGNVHEWCLDAWHGEYIGGTDPQSKPLGPLDKELFIQRGGHFEVGANRCRSASRAFSSPEFGGEYSGFRIILIESENECTAEKTDVLGVNPR
jgi:sulfatase modifying factor 1